MILSFDQRPDATVDEKVRSLMESVQRAFNSIDGGTITGTISGNNVKLIKVDGSSLVGEIDGNYVFVKNLDARSVTAEEGWVDKLMVQTGLLAHEGTVFELDAIQVNAANITAGTIDVERLVVTDAVTGKKHMVTWNETTQQWDAAYLDGNAIADNTLAAGKIVANSITTREITVENLVGTGGWINLKNGTFAYANPTTNKGITWDGSALNIKADSILLGAASEDLTATLSLKANKATLTSEINATADTVKIDANKLNITGVITAINDEGTTTIDGGRIRANSIEGNALKIGGVITAINNDTTTTISGGKIDATTINTSDLNATGVITAINNSTGTTKINGGKITTGSITATQIASNTITADEIAAEAINTSELAANAVTASKIAAGTITANEIAAHTITSAELAANAITVSEVGDDSGHHIEVTSNSIDMYRNSSNQFLSLGYKQVWNAALQRYMYFAQISSPLQIQLASDVYIGGTLDCGDISGSTIQASGTISGSTIYASGNIGRSTAPEGYSTLAGATYWHKTSNGNYCLCVQSSSRKWKEDIEPVRDQELDPHRLYDIEVVQFKFTKDYAVKDDPYNKNRINLVGFIAEDVYEHYPTAAIMDDGEAVNWNERQIIPPMLYLIQEQNERIKVLEEKYHDRNHQ